MKPEINLVRLSVSVFDFINKQSCVSRFSESMYI